MVDLDPRELAGFAALGLNIAGNLMLTSKRPGGWWVRIACNASQLLYAGLIHSPSLALNALVFAGINVYGIHKWRRMEGHTDQCGVAKRRPCNCGRFA